MQPDNLTPAGSPIAMQRAAARDRQAQNATLGRIEIHLHTIGVLLCVIAVEVFAALCVLIWRVGH